jgi:delta8-fatty-acid desaturase
MCQGCTEINARTSGWLGQMASAAFLGLLFHQLTCKSSTLATLNVVLAHDAGHTGVTGNWWWDRVIGMSVANWIGGLSLGWWCDVSSMIS